MSTNLTPELQSQIEQEAKDYANLEVCDWGKIQGNNQLDKWELANETYKDAAEPYALKWQEAEQRVKELERWREEAGSLLDPLLDWGQAQKDIPLGKSITIELLRRAKLFTEDEQRADRYEKALNNILSQLAPLCLKTHIAWRNTTIELCNEALTPKQTTDDTTNG